MLGAPEHGIFFRCPTCGREYQSFTMVSNCCADACPCRVCGRVFKSERAAERCARLDEEHRAFAASSLKLVRSLEAERAKAAASVAAASGLGPAVTPAPTAGARKPTDLDSILASM